MPAGTGVAPVRVTVVVAQLGARMHYAVPRILYAAGMLERLYTDLVATHGWPGLVAAMCFALHANGAAQRIAARAPAGVPAKKIVHWPLFAVEYYLRQRWAKSPGELTAA